MNINVVYTGWIGDRLKRAEDNISLDDASPRLQTLIDHLLQISDAHATLLSEVGVAFFSQNSRILSSPDDAIDPTAPIIIFSPIAGG